ncbi:MAG: hypothetical protein BGO97_14280 [Micrococcales bacterium 70-64]|nr:hypothetical protein [Leifsonia sp.]ODU65081.1 MAG: hypothetical protein ABT06_14280 [Leifsonia sp. SCN 70-46]OJX86773.1 MAG: hypothetical protein BGO97_14280 [Micrococcales bacterium 70-64]
MDRPQLMAIVIAVLVLLLALMALGWRARQRRQSGVAAPAEVPAQLGTPLGTFDGKYVATTTSGKPLDRIAVHGLGFRSDVSVTLTDAGVLLQRPGSDDVWIPRADVRDRRTATWTIDRVVEHDGLELVEWDLGGTAVDSYFRLAEPLEFERAFEQLLPNKAAA